jgi:hypothetical protein
VVDLLGAEQLSRGFDLEMLLLWIDVDLRGVGIFRSP